MDREQRILSFLANCKKPSAQALNIAKYIGLQSAREIQRDLNRMERKQLIRKTENNEWQLSGRADSPLNDACGPAGETGATADLSHDVPDVSHSDGSIQSTGQRQLTAGVNDGDDHRATPDRSPSQLSSGTTANISVSCFLI